MKGSSIFLASVALLCLWVSAAGATTYVNRVPPSYTVQDVTLGTTTWNAANGPYVIEAQVNVAAGATLTVQAGTQVEAMSTTGIYVYGRLLASGATFTHGDTGNWRGIYLSPDAGGSLLDNCTIAYAGADNAGFGLNISPHGYYPRAALYIDTGNPVITGCRITDSEVNGIQLYKSGATITATTFTNTGAASYPIVFDSVDTFPVMAGNATSGTGYNGIALASGIISVSGTWNRPGASFPYLMTGSLTLDAGNTLTIDPGVTVKAGGAGFYMEGSLTAAGTASLPIVFTSRAATPAPGDWLGIYLAPTAGASTLSHVTIDYAGANNSGLGLNISPHGTAPRTALYVDGISPPLADISILHSEMNALELYGASPAITNARFESYGASGLLASNGSRPAITGASFTGSGSPTNYFVSLDASSVPDPTNVTFSGTGRRGIEVRGGTLAGNATWKSWGATTPYAVTGDTSVAKGTTLTIAPTTTVKFDGTALFVYGLLKADGSAGRITFTSLADDSTGGDTNGDGAATLPAAGNWRGIYLSPDAGGSILSNCTIAYSGAGNSGYGLNISPHGYWPKAALYVDTSNPQITGCRISDSENNGIQLYKSRATITDTTFANMGTASYPVTFDTPDSFPVMAGNATSGTGQNGISLAGGTISATGSWNRPGPAFPYLMTGSLTLAAGNGLTIDPGVTVKTSGTALHVYGTLTAAGTASLPIVFTSRTVPPAPGNWRGIYLAPGAGASSLSHVTIDYAGAYNNGYGLNVKPHGYWPKAALYLDGISPPMDGVSILHAEMSGLELYGASPAITDARFENCGGSGLLASNGSRPTITGASFTGNGSRTPSSFTVSLDASSVPVPSNVTFSANSKQGIEVRGGTLASSATWKNWGAAAPYAVTGDTNVAKGATLTIVPSTTVKLWGTALFIYGLIDADGTTGRITFTSLADDAIGGDTNGNGATTLPAAGNWRGIYLSPDAGGSVLANWTIAYSAASKGGYGLNIAPHGYYPRTALYLDGISPPLAGVSILQSQVNGLELYSSSPAITNARFEGCGGTQLVAMAGSLPTISGSSFIGTSSVSGMTTDSPNLVINARGNFWGAASGPYDPSDDRANGGWYNPGGTGVRVSDGIDYSAWGGANLAVVFGGTGAGSVTADPPGVTFTANRTLVYPQPTTVNLTATADADSLFSNWSGGGCGANPDCALALNSTTQVTATFTHVAPARLQRTPPQEFETLQGACNGATSAAGNLILLRDHTFTETVTTTNAVPVTIVGGYDKSFTAPATLTLIRGSLTIDEGSAIVHNLAID